MKKLIILIILITTLLYAKDKDDNSYVLGEGLQVASLPLYVGGYFSFDYKVDEISKRYRLDDLALLAYGSDDKISYMAEFEFKAFYVRTTTEEESAITEDTKLHTERLYLEYNADENHMLRVGKYNSPIGYWNLLPVNVLRDTTSNPNTTYVIYPQYTTGIQATYSSYTAYDFQVDLMLQNNSDIDPKYNNYEIDKHYGIGITYAKDNLSIKLNVGMFNVINYYNEEYEEGGNEDEDDNDEGDDSGEEDNRLRDSKRYYALLSAKFDTDNFQFMTEIGSQKSIHDFTTKYAGYIQGLYRFNEKYIAILRAESYENNANKKSENFGLLGFTYRPLYPVAIKTEYQVHSISKNSKFLVSFSMMF